MILGRSTPQWIGLITAIAGFLQVVLPITTTIDAMVLSIILGSATGLLGVFIAFLANTRTTPIDDARLKIDTEVSVLDAQGRLSGDTVTIKTSPPGPVGHDSVEPRG